MRSPLTGVGLIIAASVAVALLVGTGGNFPLSDDWSYYHSVRVLCEEGRMEFLPWTGASLVFQTFYGAALCKLFGLSYTMLRISTLVLAAGGVVGFFLLLRAAGLSAPFVILAVVSFGLDPLYVNQAFTFMTDVPAAVFAVWAAYFYLRGLSENRIVLVLIASCLAAACLLIRQHGIFLAAAASLAALLAAGEQTSERRIADRIRVAVAAGAVPLVALGAYLFWIFALQDTPSGLQNKVREAAAFTPLGVGNAAFRGLEYLGLLLAPLAAALLPAVYRHQRSATLTAIVIAAVLAAVLFFSEGVLMPSLTNVIYDFGLGPLSLRDNQFLALPPIGQLGNGFRVVLTVVSVVSLGVLSVAWALGLARLRDVRSGFLWLAFAALFLGSLIHARFYFDRYLIIVIPFAIAAAASAFPDTSPRALPFLIAALLGWYAVAGTHDYMSWNRVRFDALADLEAQGVGPKSIDGGFEYNAERFAAAMGTWPTNEEAIPGQPHTKKSWWWVHDDEYIVSFAELPGYDVNRRLAYSRWLLPGDGELLVLELQPGG